MYGCVMDGLALLATKLHASGSKILPTQCGHLASLYVKLLGAIIHLLLNVLYVVCAS